MYTCPTLLTCQSRNTQHPYTLTRAASSFPGPWHASLPTLPTQVEAGWNCQVLWAVQQTAAGTCGLRRNSWCCYATRAAPARKCRPGYQVLRYRGSPSGSRTWFLGQRAKGKMNPAGSLGWGPCRCYPAPVPMWPQNHPSASLWPQSCGSASWSWELSMCCCCAQLARCSPGVRAGEDRLVVTWRSSRRGSLGWTCSWLGTPLIRHGQLGHGTLEAELEPRLLEALQGLRMAKVAAGGWHSVCLSGEWLGAAPNKLEGLAPPSSCSVFVGGLAQASFHAQSSSVIPESSVFPDLACYSTTLLHLHSSGYCLSLLLSSSLPPSI
jgi:hypothetical protein